MTDLNSHETKKGHAYSEDIHSPFTPRNQGLFISFIIIYYYCFSQSLLTEKYEDF